MAKKWKWTGKVSRATRDEHLNIVARAALKAIARDGGLDSKRPFGNSDIYGDVQAMIGLVAPVTGDAEFDWWQSREGEDAADYCTGLFEDWAQHARRVLGEDMHRLRVAASAK